MPKHRYCCLQYKLYRMLLKRLSKQMVFNHKFFPLTNQIRLGQGSNPGQDTWLFGAAIDCTIRPTPDLGQNIYLYIVKEVVVRYIYIYKMYKPAQTIQLRLLLCDYRTTHCFYDNQPVMPLTNKKHRPSRWTYHTNHITLFKVKWDFSFSSRCSFSEDVIKHSL